MLSIHAGYVLPVLPMPRAESSGHAVRSPAATAEERLRVRRQELKNWDGEIKAAKSERRHNASLYVCQCCMQHLQQYQRVAAVAV